MAQFGEAMNPDELVLQAQAALRGGDPDTAIVQLQKALQVSPSNVSALGLLSAAYAQKGMVPEAIQQCIAAVNANPSHAVLRYNLGTLYQRAGDNGNAQGQYEAALQLDPTYSNALQGLASLGIAPPPPPATPVGYSQPVVSSALASSPAGVGTATCVNHPSNAASHFCSGCGKPMCTQCEIASGPTYVCDRCFTLSRGTSIAGAVGHGATMTGVVVENVAGVRQTMEMKVNFPTRFVASFIDTLVLLIPNIVLGMFIPFGGYIAQFGYSTLLMGNGSGRTLGMKALGIRVVNADGTAYTYGNAALRWLASMLSTLILCIGFLMIAFDPDKQSLHDKLCKTYVVGRENVQPWIFWVLLVLVIGGFMALFVAMFFLGFALMRSMPAPTGRGGGFPAPGAPGGFPMPPPR